MLFQMVYGSLLFYLCEYLRLDKYFSKKVNFTTANNSFLPKYEVGAKKTIHNSEQNPHSTHAEYYKPQTDHFDWKFVTTATL